ncbi:MAG: twin-arginine translocase subunit TatC, partial [Polynucleobacter victoriensis]
MSAQQTPNQTPEQTPESDKEEGIQETFLTHLFELRDRLIKSVAALLVVFLGLVYWAPDIFHLFSKPLLDALPNG